MRSARLAAAIAATGLALSLTACSSSEDTPEASSEYCASSQVLADELTALREMISAGTGTVDELNEQRREVRTAYAQAVEDADGLVESVADDIARANETFEDALGDIPNDATIDEAAAAYNSAAAAYRDEIAQIRTEAGC